MELKSSILTQVKNDMISIDKLTNTNIKYSKYENIAEVYCRIYFPDSSEYLKTELISYLKNLQFLKVSRKNLIKILIEYYKTNSAVK